MPPLQLPRLNPAALLQSVQDGLMRMQQKIQNFFAEFNRRINNLPQTNYDLGLQFAREGKVKDALFRFKVVLWFSPQFVQAHYNLACCQLAAGQKDKAIASFKKTLQLKPDHAEAKFMLATIDPSILAAQHRPLRMPIAMNEGFFAQIASRYDALQREAAYAGPALLHKAVRAKLGRGDLRVLDIGCGTGLAAAPWRKEATYVAGVDVAPEMTALAKQAAVDGTPIYDEVATRDVTAPHFAPPGGTYDLVLALSVLPYVGEAAAFITNMAKSLAEGGMVALTIEPYNGTGGFGVVPATARFGHSAEYIKQLAHAAGLLLVGEASVALYPGGKDTLLMFAKAKDV